MARHSSDTGTSFDSFRLVRCATGKEMLARVS
jgi:hypothetical protein